MSVRKLALSIIYRAIHDLNRDFQQPLTADEKEAAVKSAVEFLNMDNQHFHDICDMAEVDPSWVLTDAIGLELIGPYLTTTVRHGSL